jgi:hypothetical protein
MKSYFVGSCRERIWGTTTLSWFAWRNWGRSRNVSSEWHLLIAHLCRKALNLSELSSTSLWGQIKDELNSYIKLWRNSVFKGLNISNNFVKISKHILQFISYRVKQNLSMLVATSRGIGSIHMTISIKEDRLVLSLLVHKFRSKIEYYWR